jgi:hypothetical protein
VASVKAAAVACLLAIAVVATGCRDTGVVTASYATLAEAVAAGAVARGYLPEGLPPGTRDIREAHDPASTSHWALFSFPPAEGDHLRALLEPQEVSLDGLTCDVPGRIEWWPVLLRNRLDAARIAATGLRSYKGRGADLLYAVNWSQGRAYLWVTE